MAMDLIAIDPGASGGIARLCPDGTVLALPMPKTHKDTVVLLAIAPAINTIAYVEEVGGYIGRPQPGSAMFKFGFGAGVIHGVLLALGVPIHMTKPQKWQTALGLGTSRGMSKTKWKNKLKARAQELFPKVKVTLSTADALLILEFARRQQNQAPVEASPSEGFPPPVLPHRSLDVFASENGKATCEVIVP